MNLKNFFLDLDHDLQSFPLSSLHFLHQSFPLSITCDLKHTLLEPLCSDLHQLIVLLPPPFQIIFPSLLFLILFLLNLRVLLPSSLYYFGIELFYLFYIEYRSTNRTLAPSLYAIIDPSESSGFLGNFVFGHMLDASVAKFVPTGELYGDRHVL